MAYCRRAAAICISCYLRRQSAPVSASDGKVRELDGLLRAPLTDDCWWWMPDRESELDEARWLRATREALRPLLADDGLLPGRRVVYDGARSREVARDLGLDVREVYRSAVRFRDAVWSSGKLWRLWRDKDALDRARD